MITALDTSVLIDVLLKDPDYLESSRTALIQASRKGALIISPVVAGEIRSAYPDDEIFTRLLFEFSLHVPPLELRDAVLAGAMHRLYLAAGGKRNRIVADFLIGAHALHHADVLLTRDRGFFRSCFSDLKIWHPEHEFDV
jgi:predicted nucleic acid-binding protein